MEICSVGILSRSISFIIWLVRDKNIVGIRVRQARRAAKPSITQTDLVARLQILGMVIDQSGMSKIESGLRPVSDKEVVVLAKALNVSVAWLLGEAI
jgi:transcriptional regulator with XRE-family HTH domain